MEDRHPLVDGVPGHKGDGLFLHPLMMELGGESLSKAMELRSFWNNQRLQVAAKLNNSMAEDLPGGNLDEDSKHDLEEHWIVHPSA